MQADLVRKIKRGEVKRDAVRGQYGAGTIAGKRVTAYRKEEDVSAHSQVETYAALKLHIDNMRWAGVPFYLRSGKGLAKAATEIVIEFKPAPHTPWKTAGSTRESVRPNLLIINVSPDEGIAIRVEAKQSGQEMRLQSVNIDYCNSDKGGTTESPSAYEHLLLDCMHGDPTFFARADEVEAAWEIIDPILKKWATEKSSDFRNYAAGSSGPPEADNLLASDGRRWHKFTGQTNHKLRH